MVLFGLSVDLWDVEDYRNRISVAELTVSGPKYESGWHFDLWAQIRNESDACFWMRAHSSLHSFVLDAQSQLLLPALQAWANMATRAMMIIRMISAPEGENALLEGSTISDG